jgi:hypothetical protein
MDKRVQVFVSSTYIDLMDERQRVNQILLQLECFPAGMELFPASDEDKWDLIKGVIDDSDYYLLILGGRYGSLDDSTKLSYTQMEFEYAVEQKKPVIAFLHKNLDSIAIGKSENDPKKAKKLRDFRESVAAKKTVRFYETADELAAQVATSLVALQKKFPAVGWVRGDNAMTPETRAEIAELRAALAEAKAAGEVQPGPMFDDLASGDETLRMEGGVMWETLDGRTVEKDIDIQLSWNNLLAALGPTLLHETTQDQLQQRLSGVIDSDAHRVLQKAFPLFSHIIDTSFPTTRLLDDILVQFLALRWIERGTGHRAASNTDRYWKLTGLGEDTLMALRAIRRTLPAVGS